MDSKNKTLTIAILVGGIIDDFTKTVCEGACSEAAACGVHVCVFPGKYLNRYLPDSKSLKYEYQNNIDFLLPTAESFDAIIGSTGSIGYYTDDSALPAFISRFKGIPFVQVASHLPDCSSVVYDNRNGILEGLEYSYAHGGRHFGMIGAGSGNCDTAERKETFMDFLKSKDIAFEDRMYTESTCSCNGECVAYDDYLNRYPEVDTIFCANDGTALELYQTLKRRNIVPGKDISVFGYDDTLAAARATPSLSSVWAEGDKLGKEAMDLAISIIGSGNIEHKRIETRFIKRDSVISGHEKNSNHDYNLGADEESWFGRIFYRYHAEYDRLEISQIHAHFHTLFTHISRIIAPHDEADKKDLLEKFYSLINDMLSLRITEFADVDNFLLFIEAAIEELNISIHSNICRTAFAKESRLLYCDIVESFNQQNGKWMSDYEQESRNLQFFAQGVMQFENGHDSNYASILQNITYLGFTDAALYILEQPIINFYDSGFAWPENIDKKAEMRGGNVRSVPDVKQKRKTHSIWSAGLDAPQVVFPLFSNEVVYGFIVCGLIPSVYKIGEFFSTQISSAVKMIDLLRTNERNQLRLDALSKQDGLTDIFNRRGFYNAAENIRISCKRRNRPYMIIFADMNNLKLVNDQFGHEEGDFALKKISNVLSGCILPDGIAGRIGGDEFACIVPDFENDDDKRIIDAITQKLAEFNCTKQKPYLITISAGTSVFYPQCDLSISDALSQVDERMYEVKKLRKKEIDNRM